MLDGYDKRLVKEGHTDKYFKFGDGNSIKAQKSMRFPGYIGKERILIDTEVIDYDIPLLFSRTFMKSLGMVIDLGEDKIYWRKGFLVELL